MGKGRKLKNLAVFTRQLAVLVASGVALADALGALERQSKDAAWRQLVATCGCGSRRACRCPRRWPPTRTCSTPSPAA
jgi:type II secretory pathway component PulF